MTAYLAGVQERLQGGRAGAGRGADAGRGGAGTSADRAVPAAADRGAGGIGAGDGGVGRRRLDYTSPNSGKNGR